MSAHVLQQPYIRVQVREPRLKARCYHRATALVLNPQLTEVTLFGGCPWWPKDIASDPDLPQIADTAVLRFGEHD